MVVHVAEDEDQVSLTMTSEGPLDALIGKSAQVLNALEMITALIVRQKIHAYGKRMVVDADGYRAQQEERLAELARATVEKVLASGEPVALDPMNARDRRIVHTAVTEMEGISTTSEGEDPYRHVVVYPIRDEEE